MPSFPSVEWFDAIKDIGFVEDRNSKHRKTMEDGHCMIDGLQGQTDCFLAVYDGHGGRNGVDHVQEVLHQVTLYTFIFSISTLLSRRARM